MRMFLVSSLLVLSVLLSGCNPQSCSSPAPENNPTSTPSSETPQNSETKTSTTDPNSPFADPKPTSSAPLDSPFADPKTPTPAPAPAATEPKKTQQVSGIQQERLNNPIFKSSLEFLKDPVPAADSVAATDAEMKPYTDKIPGTEIIFKMVPIKGGKFLMGSPETEKGRNADEGPQKEVEVKAFWMEEHETTWKEFEQFALKMLRNTRPDKSTLPLREQIADALACPTAPYNIGSISHDNAGKPGYPASGMTAYAGQAYCKWLTTLTGRYYRLPTEAEWEYACRAGTTTPYSFDEDKIDDYAWYYDNSDGVSHVVKKKKPNPWGLYDMHGNLAEWVLEQYDAKSYENRKPEMFGAPVKKLIGKDFGQVARGGHCEDDELANLRSAKRTKSVEDWKQQDPQFPQSIWWVTDAAYVGFRVVRPLDPPKTAEEAAMYEPDAKIWLDYSTLNQRD